MSTNFESPLVKTLSGNTDAVAATADKTTNIGEAPFAGTVTEVTVAMDSTLTGANTDSRTLSLINKGANGSGTTVIATKAFTNGVNAPASTETPLTLSATPANLVVAAGDILALQSTHVGTSGLADPGGMIEIEISRNDS